MSASYRQDRIDNGRATTFPAIRKSCIVIRQFSIPSFLTGSIPNELPVNRKIRLQIYEQLMNYLPIDIVKLTKA